MRVGIIGGGVVGQATARAFLEHVEEVRVYDKDPTRRTDSGDGTLDCDVIFICLPTPAKEDGSCDTRFVEQQCSYLHEHRRKNFVLKSTVPIGFTKSMTKKYGLENLVHSPEFLTARCAAADAQMPTRNVIGVPNSDLPRTQYEMMPIVKLYEKRWPHTPILRMSSSESEAVKLAQNAFFAIKVSFWNEVRALCKKLELDYDVVLNAILADGRIHPSHTMVPGPDGKLGFGGACLPKDLQNLIHCFSGAGICAYTLHAAELTNKQVRDDPRPNSSAVG